MTFKVPREYLLQEQPVIKNDAGDIEAIYLTVALPGATAWQPMPRARDSDPPEERAGYEKHRRSRQFVIVHRLLQGSAAWREAVRREGRGGTPGYARDGTVAGLERYSRMLCREGPRGPANQKFIDSKPPDDPSPPNCRFDRGSSLLVSPPEVTANNEGVAVSCMSTGCAVYFVSGRRGTKIQLSHEDLPRWQEYVEPIRMRIDSFVAE